MFLLSVVTIICSSVYFINFYLHNFEKSLSNGNVIINKSIKESKLTKSFICSYESNNPLLSEIWFEKVLLQP